MSSRKRMTVPSICQQDARANTNANDYGLHGLPGLTMYTIARQLQLCRMIS